jgi:hypothetical protein
VFFTQYCTYISSAQKSNIVFKESKEFLAIVLFIQCVATVEFSTCEKGFKTGSGSGSGNPPDRSTGKKEHGEIVIS